MTGTLPVNSSPSRSAERSNCTVIARCSPSKTAKRRPAQRSPFCSSAPVARQVSESPFWVLMQHAMLTAR